MSGQPNLFGEIHEDEGDKIVKIAHKAADERGYATYRDFNDLFWERICQEKPEGADIGRSHQKIELEIMEVLRDWVSPPLAAGEERRFYPPGTDLERQRKFFPTVEFFSV